VSAVTVNGLPAISAELTVPRVGVWYADVSLVRSGEATTLAGVVTLEVGNTTWMGTVRRAGENRGIITARIVGGADGLMKEVPARAYQGVPVRLPIEELLSEVGEVISPTSDATILSAVLQQWSRSAGGAGSALRALLEIAGASTWRVLPDGTLWIGSESWPASALADYTYLSHTPCTGFIEIVAWEPKVYPGEVFRERRVSAVTHRWNAQQLRTRVWFEDESGAGDLDRLTSGLASFVRAQFPRLDHYAAYWARVVAQNADGTLELVPDDARIPGRSNVPIRYGVPGVTAKVAAGARVLLEFASGDPSKPFATVWESAVPTEIVVAGGTKGAARVDDTVNAAGIVGNSGMALWMSQVELAINFLLPGSIVPVSTDAVAGALRHFGVIAAGSAKVKVG
jgi:hypothetical protein